MNTATTHIKSEKQLVPELRFKEFEGQFQLKEFDEITDITRLAGYEYSKYWKEDEEQEIIALRGYNIGKGELVLRDLGYISNALSMQLIRSRLSIGDIVYPCVGSIGKAVVIEENDKFHIQQNIAKITCNEFASPYYVVQFLTSDYGMREVYRFNASGAQPNVLVGSLRQYRINIPSLPEQQKIASFLSAVDQKIQQLTKKKALLEQYKKGVMQQLFSGQLRFKDENGNPYPDWEEKRLGEYLIHKSTRNKDLSVELVLSVSNKKGFISQEEQFDGYEVASKDVSNYKIVDRDDIAYNPSRINVGSIARLINFEQGIVSPMYVIFSLKNGLNKIFFENLYNTHRFKHLIKVGCSGSVRDSLNFDDLCDFEFKFPSIEEQQKIATYLSSIDTKIGAVNNQITQTQTFKKGLLQQMFV